MLSDFPTGTTVLNYNMIHYMLHLRIPFTQGCELQSSMSTLHLTPVKPASQLQVKSLTLSRHVPKKIRP